MYLYLLTHRVSSRHHSMLNMCSNVSTCTCRLLFFLVGPSLISVTSCQCVTLRFSLASYAHQKRTWAWVWGSLVPRPLSEKSRTGLATVPYNGLSRAVYTVCANQIAEFSYVKLIASWPIQVGVVLFDKALILLRERMGSKKLLLNQKEVASGSFRFLERCICQFSHLRILPISLL